MTERYDHSGRVPAREGEASSATTSSASEEASQSANDHFRDIFTEYQAHQADRLDEGWIERTLRRTGWCSITEYLLATSGLIPEPPADIEDQAVRDDLRQRYREQVSAVVRRWKDEEAL